MISRRAFCDLLGVASISLASDVRQGGRSRLFHLTQAKDELPADPAVPVRRLLSCAQAESDYPQIPDAVALDPLDEDVAGFGVLEIEEEGGTRLVTPYYSVLVPDGMFPHGFDYSYYDEIHSWRPDHLSYFRGRGLSLFPRTEEGPSANLAFQVYVTSTDWEGVQGSLLDLPVGPTAGRDDAWVVVARYIVDEQPPYQATRASLYEYAGLVSTAVIYTVDADGAPAVSSFEQEEAPAVLCEDGIPAIDTSWCRVCIDPGLWPHGCDYHCVDARGRSDWASSTINTKIGILGLFVGATPIASIYLRPIDFEGTPQNSDWAEVGVTSDGTGKVILCAALPQGESYSELVYIPTTRELFLEQLAGSIEVK